MILAFKNDRLDLVKPLSAWLSTSARTIILPEMLVAPVPLHATRFLKRRYNQSALLAQEVARLNTLDYIPDLLTRTRRTTPQFGSSVDREQNLEGAITLTPRFVQSAQGRHILLIDDVLTSGATLKACALACLHGGAAKVSVAVLARVARDA
jgi:ComF family protein